jgi:cytochrome P450
MVLSEALRLYPPVVAMLRRAAADIELDDGGRRIEVAEGTEVILPVLAWHHDADYWGDDVHEFRPDRFDRGRRPARSPPSGAYLPFSAGPRVCIGQGFAALEARTVLAALLLRFRFRVSPSYRHAPATLLTLQPEFGAPLLVSRLWNAAE